MLNLKQTLIVSFLSTATLFTVGESKVYAHNYGGGTEVEKVEINKLVRDPKTGNFVDDLTHADFTFKTGDTVTYMIRYRNTGTIDLDDVTIEDRIPSGFSLGDIIDGNKTGFDSSSNTVKFSHDGTLKADSKWIEIRFDTKIESDAEAGDRVNTAIFKVDGDEKTRDTASIFVASGEVKSAQLPETGPTETAALTVISLIMAGAGLKLRKI